MDGDPATTTVATKVTLQGALAWFVVSYGVAVLGYLALYAMASRFVGPQSFGTFVIVITVTTLVGELALVGVHRSGLREVARLGVSDGDKIAELRQGVRAVTLTSLPLAGLSGAGVTWVLLGSRGTAERLWVSLAVAALVILSGHQKLWGNYLRGFGNVRFASLMEGRAGGALIAVLQSLCLGAVWIVMPGTQLEGALAALAVGYLLPVLAAYWTVAKQWRGQRMEPSLWRDFKRVADRDWRFSSGQLASYVNANLELWMAGILLSLVDTSMFGAAQRLALIIVTPLTSLQVVFSPVIARSEAGSRDGLQSLVRTGATLAAVPMVVILIPVVIAPKEVLGLVFGSEYRAAAPVLLLLLVGSVANVLTGLCGAVLSMTHREGIVATIQWVGVGVRVVAGAAAALFAGATGLGASAGLVTAGIWIALWAATYRHVGVSTHPTLRPQLRLMRETTG